VISTSRHTLVTLTSSQSELRIPTGVGVGVIVGVNVLVGVFVGVRVGVSVEVAVGVVVAVSVGVRDDMKGSSPDELQDVRERMRSAKKIGRLQCIRFDTRENPLYLRPMRKHSLSNNYTYFQVDFETIERIVECVLTNRRDHLGCRVV
jgi:hypothetical protein